MTLRPDEVIEVFDRLAPRYGQIIPFFAAMAGQVVAALPVGAGARVLDLDAGGTRRLRIVATLWSARRAV